MFLSLGCKLLTETIIPLQGYSNGGEKEKKSEQNVWAAK